METVSLNGKEYFLLIKDDYLWEVWVEPFANKIHIAAKVWEFVIAFESGYNTHVWGYGG